MKPSDDKSLDILLLAQIADQAERVRLLQQKYFESRSRSILTKSKEAERELDRLIESRRQGRLFE